jgi:hypothetical protein
MRHWFDAVSGLGLQHGASFDLDFHTIPFHGEDALVEKHYVSKRSRRHRSINRSLFACRSVPTTLCFWPRDLTRLTSVSRGSTTSDFISSLEKSAVWGKVFG